MSILQAHGHLVVAAAVIAELTQLHLHPTVVPPSRENNFPSRRNPFRVAYYPIMTWQDVFLILIVDIALQANLSGDRRFAPTDGNGRLLVREVQPVEFSGQLEHHVRCVGGVSGEHLALDLGTDLQLGHVVDLICVREPRLETYVQTIFTIP